MRSRIIQPRAQSHRPSVPLQRAPTRDLVFGPKSMPTLPKHCLWLFGRTGIERTERHTIPQSPRLLQ
jgi:hypothetical protein